MKGLLTKLDSCCCLIAIISIVQSLPLQDIENSQGVQNGTDVCVHGEKTYKSGENFSTSNPCETCTCDPPGISCSLISCDLKPGCKAMHKANQCCPEYVCAECERNGRIYGNGEKVEEPNPCKVCYCKGGEIKCALVTCYTRDDCEPGYVAGVCCPKYDHCPPLEMMKNKTTTPAPAQVIISDLKTESPPTKHNNLRKAFSLESTTVDLTEPVTDVTTDAYDGADASNATTETTTYETTETTTEMEYNTSTTIEDYTTEEVTTEVDSTTTEETQTEDNMLDSFREATVADYTDTTTASYETETTTELVNATTDGDLSLELLDDPESTTIPSETTTTTEKSDKSVIKVIVPKSMKKDLDMVQKTIDVPGPIVVMISADQIQFLKLAEEPPVYVENRDADNHKPTQDYVGVVVVPKTTPTTVEMVKVINGTSVSDVTNTTESNHVNTNYNIQER